jgi:hypothetical protein
VGVFFLLLSAHIQKLLFMDRRKFSRNGSIAGIGALVAPSTSAITPAGSAKDAATASTENTTDFPLLEAKRVPPGMVAAANLNA